MGRKKTVEYTCDVCGEEIDGDFLELRYSVGVSSWRCYYTHVPRTAALIPCGNQTIERLKALFPHNPEGGE